MRWRKYVLKQNRWAIALVYISGIFLFSTPLRAVDHADDVAARTTNKFPAYDAFVNKLSELVKSSGSSNKAERVEGGTIHVLPAKEDLEKGITLLKRIKWYREKISEACENTDASAKLLGQTLDSCVASGVLADAASKATLVRDKFEFSFNLSSIQECRKTFIEYFQEKAKITEKNRSPFEVDKEMENKIVDFFDIFGGSRAPADKPAKENKLVEEMKKVNRANLCQVDGSTPLASEKVKDLEISKPKTNNPEPDKSLEVSKPRLSKESSDSEAEKTAQKTDDTSSLKSEKKDAIASSAKDAAKVSGSPCPTGQSCAQAQQGGYKVPEGGYKVPDGGYKVPEGGYKAPEGGYKFNPNDYKFDPRKYQFDPNQYRFDQGNYGGGYNPLMYLPKQNYNQDPNYQPSHPQYYPPPPPRNDDTPPPIQQPIPQQPYPQQPNYPMMPFMPYSPTPVSSGPIVFGLSGGSSGGSYRPPVVVQRSPDLGLGLGLGMGCTQKLLGKPCQPMMPGLGIPGMPGYPGMPGIPGFPNIPGMPVQPYQPTIGMPPVGYPPTGGYPPKYPYPPTIVNRPPTYPPTTGGGYPGPVTYQPTTQNINNPPIRIQVPRGFKKSLK